MHVAACFGTLCNDDIRPRFRGCNCVFDLSDLVKHDRAGCFGLLYRNLRYVPEEAHRIYTVLETDREFFIEQLRRGRRRDKVDAERSRRLRADCMNLLFDELWCFAHHAQESEAARIRNCRRQISPCDTTHPSLQDRITTPKYPAHFVEERRFVFNACIQPFH